MASASADERGKTEPNSRTRRRNQGELSNRGTTEIEPSEEAARGEEPDPESKRPRRPVSEDASLPSEAWLG